VTHYDNAAGLRSAEILPFPEPPRCLATPSDALITVRRVCFLETFLCRNVKKLTGPGIITMPTPMAVWQSRAHRRARSPTMIDLRALSDNRPATEMILLARGQLNRAFRSKGLLPPDPLPVEQIAEVDLVDLDDPAGRGIGRALETYPEAFNDWSARLPRNLVSPVLVMLGGTMERLKGGSSKDRAKLQFLEQACDYLLLQLPRPGQGASG
jgi:hypothetical protein